MCQKIFLFFYTREHFQKIYSEFTREIHFHNVCQWDGQKSTKRTPL